jgi:hypothetical protein
VHELIPVAALGAAIVVVAGALALVLILLWLPVRRLVRRDDDDDEQALRRCDRCGRGWRAVPGREVTVIGLRFRRWVRRRMRARGAEAVPHWAGPFGWSRCPSCLSTQVRTSGEALSRESWTGLEKIGIFAGIAGLSLLLVAAAAAAL